MKIFIKKLEDKEPHGKEERAAFRQAAYLFMLECIKSIGIDIKSGGCETPAEGDSRLQAAEDPVIRPFAKDSLGKPFLPGHPEVVFNLSHSRNGYAAVAAAMSGEAAAVGIDVERRIPYQDALARKICSDAEAGALRQAETEEERESLLGLFWSRKEAILKCRGTGIRSPLSMVDTLHIDKKRYYMVEKQTEDYTLVVCMERAR